MRAIPKPDNTTENKRMNEQTNKRTMSKADNYNEYDYDQVLGEEHAG